MIIFSKKEKVLNTKNKEIIHLGIIIKTKLEAKVKAKENWKIEFNHQIHKKRKS